MKKPKPSADSKPSVRAQVIEARTYLRPLDEEGNKLETPEQAVERVISHQRWLWSRAKGGMHKGKNGWYLEELSAGEEAELATLQQLLLDRKVTVAGRTRWLGGTEISKKRESTQFNCSGVEVRTVHDVVDVLWLLLQGCGVGFRPIVGTLNGFAKPMEIEVIRSKRGPKDKGPENNVETIEDGVWTIKVGDSAEAWARSAGKLLACKLPARKLVLDFSQLRGAGGRLSQYGWISSGDSQIAVAYEAIAQILNKRNNQLLTRIDLLDVMNWLGTILSSRRSAEIALMEHGEQEWEQFAVAKKDCWKNGNPQRGMSNNSLMFYRKPTKYQLQRIFRLIEEGGGSEPGFINAEQAQIRAPWFHTINPCAEILLPDKGFCNLVETMLHRFNGDFEGLLDAHRILARANYRQTCVDLRDEVLQEAWHQNNQFLRLCGVGVTGAVGWEHCNEPEAWSDLRQAALDGAHSMADELGMPRAKAVTTVKPAGTQSKVAGIIGAECPEGIHKPLGRYLFNHVRFSVSDPLVKKLKRANFYTFPDPQDNTAILVRMPVEYPNVEFGHEDDKGVPLNGESAIDQLERYRMVMGNYVDHNASVTISYDKEEVPAIIEWLQSNWSSYVGVSFLYRTDPTKSAEDLGYPYLPQEVVDAETFNAYVSSLKSVNVNGIDANPELEVEDQSQECAGGACPIR